MLKYIRTCQECGHKQESKPPLEYKSDSWQNTKCRKCKSEALDYGSFKPADTSPQPAGVTGSIN